MSNNSIPKNKASKHSRGHRFLKFARDVVVTLVGNSMGLVIVFSLARIIGAFSSSLLVVASFAMPLVIYFTLLNDRLRKMHHYCTAVIFLVDGAVVTAGLGLTWNNLPRLALIFAIWFCLFSVMDMAHTAIREMGPRPCPSCARRTGIQGSTAGPPERHTATES